MNGFLNNNLAAGILIIGLLVWLYLAFAACIDNYGNCPL